MEGILLMRQQVRRLGATPIIGPRAPRMIRTTRRGLDHGRHLTGCHIVLCLSGVINTRNGRQQRLRIRMQRIAVNHLGRGVLDNAAQIHHGQVIADVFDHGQIVGDEQVCQMQFVLKVLQEIDDLRLNGNIQGTDRFVTHNEFRRQGQSSGNTDPLPLTTGKFVRITTGSRGGQAHTIQKRSHTVTTLLSTRNTMHRKRLADNIAHGHSRIQRPHRVLKDHLHAAAQLPKRVRPTEKIHRARRT